MPKLNDITGNKYGMLTVLKRLPTVKKWKQWHTRYLVECECGVIREMNARDMLYGNTISCGCMRYKGNILECGESAFRRTLRYYKRNAKNRGKVFAITEDEFRKITKENCFYCGIEPSNRCNGNARDKNYGHYTYSGVDGLNSELGYTLDNVVPCCRRCNVAKNDMSFEEFSEWVNRLKATFSKNILKIA